MKPNRRDFLNSLSLSALPFIPNPFAKEKKVYSNNPPSFVRKDVGTLKQNRPGYSIIPESRFSNEKSTSQ